MICLFFDIIVFGGIMINIFLYISFGLILGSYILYFLMIVFNNKKITDSNGFDVTKDIISEYNSINVIESKNYFSIYNIKRKVIKLSTKCYYGNGISDIVISLIEAGISILDNNKNKYIDLFRKIFNNLKILYIFPLVCLIINSVTYNISDAKISIVFTILFSVIWYILYDIKNQVCILVSDNLDKIKDINKNNSLKIVNYFNKILLLDKIVFCGMLILIIRNVLILLEFNK